MTILQNLKTSTGLECPDVFQFKDFREYLQAYYIWRKHQFSSFSVHMLARKIGISTTYMHMILNGKRPLPESRISKFAECCELKPWEARYFIALVLWNQCTDERVKKSFFDNLMTLKPQDNVHFVQGPEHLLYSKWFVIPLLEMTHMSDFEPNASWIKNRLRGDVSEEEVSLVLQQLLGMGVISEQNGAWSTQHQIRIGDSAHIPTQLIREYHKQNIQKALHSIESVEVALRQILAATVSISSEDLPRLSEKCMAFRDEILEFNSDSKSSNEVYQLNIQLFPLTKPVSSEGNHE